MKIVRVMPADFAASKRPDRAVHVGFPNRLAAGGGEIVGQCTRASAPPKIAGENGCWS